MRIGRNQSDFRCSRAERFRESLSLLGEIVKIGRLNYLYTLSISVIAGVGILVELIQDSTTCRLPTGVE